MSEGCQADIGWYGLSPAESLAGAWGCPDQAVVTLRAACRCGHERSKRLCAKHGVTEPPDGVWLCRACAEQGHDCPVRPEVVSGERDG